LTNRSCTSTKRHSLLRYVVIIWALGGALWFIKAQDKTPSSSKQDTQTLSGDSTKTQPKGFVIDSEIKYKAKDSIFSDLVTKKTYLYGEAEVSYQEVLLTAHTIILDIDSSTAVAYGTKDSLGVEIGLPVFKDPSGEYTMRKMKYNFKTEKAIIEHIVTEQGEGFVVGQTAKKLEDNTYCMANAKYSTCSNHDHPHFYLNLTKAKVIPGKKTITGPAYLVIEDVKLPIGVPFAMIPSTSSYSSGFLFPSYRDESERGFGLAEGGYYWAATDNYDAMINGDIYTNGSWASRFASNYKVRYRYSGQVNMQYITNVFSEEDLPDYRKTKDMALTWSHRQDAKANPYRTFSGNINYSTSSFDQNNINTLYNGSNTDISRNTKRSSVSYSRRWAGRPFNFSANALHSQNSADSTIDLTIPDLTFTVNRLYPFKNKDKVGTKENLLEKINLSYSGNSKNYIHTKERDLSLNGNSLVNDWQNGVKHSIPVSMNLKLLKYFTFNPSFNYTERWYFKSIKKAYDEELGQVVTTDTTSGFNRVSDYNFSASTSTKIYSFYKPSRVLFGDKVEAIRHVLTPSLSGSYNPDFSQEKYGYYDYFEYYDKNTQEVVRKDYSYYDNSVYGVPGSGRQGGISYSLGNTLEMKVKSDKDTTGFKKISILESLNFSSAYNFLADSLNMSTVNMSGRTKVFGTNINFGAQFDPYATDTTKYGNPIRINEYLISKTGKLMNLTNANLSFGLSFSSDMFNKKKGVTTTADEGDDVALPGEDPFNQQKFDPEKEFGGKDKDTNMAMDNDGYAAFDVPWSLSVNYSFRLVKDKFNKENMDYDFKVTSDLNFNGNISLTPKWKANFSSGYNFELNEIIHTNVGISRNLHCWSMNLNLVPVGKYKSYFFTLRVNSSMLQDLKVEKRKHPRDNSSFYN